MKAKFWKFYDSKWFVIALYVTAWSAILGLSTACAAVQPALPGFTAQSADSVRVVQLTAEQVANVLDNPTTYNLTTYARPDSFCPVCWLSWSDAGQRFYAMSQAGANGAVNILPRGLCTTGACMTEVERNITNAGWTVVGKYVLDGLSVVTKNPGLLTVSLVELTPNLGFDMFEQMAYPKTIQ